MAEDERMKILFVDDEPNVLDGIRRMLRPMRNEWEVSFAGGGQEALDAMAEKPFDVIVSDIHMPGMSGTELLEEVREQYPATVRIALSGQAGKDDVFKSVGPIHQYLSKPCDAETLKSTVVRACALRGLRENEKLKAAVSEMESLPSMPDHYTQLLAELASPDASVKRLEKIVSQDMGMSTKLLQLVNSSFFGVGRRVSNPAQAIVMLGLDTVKKLVLITHVFSQFKGINVKGFSLDALWSHSVASAGFAKRIAKDEKAKNRACEDAFIAGLLHDVGKLVLASKLPDEYGKALKLATRGRGDVLEAEREVFAATHAEVGAYLLGLWGLSDSVVEAVAFHHHPARASGREFTPLTAVHVANVVAHGGCKADGSDDLPDVDADYLAALGLAERLPAWLEICQEAQEEEKDQ